MPEPPPPAVVVDGATRAAPKGTEAIDALGNVPRERCGALECAICLQDATGDGGAAAGWKETPCGHRFHGDCLGKWLRLRGTCPMCRRQLTPETPAAALDVNTLLETMEGPNLATAAALEAVRGILVRIMGGHEAAANAAFLTMMSNMMAVDAASITYEEFLVMLSNRLNEVMEDYEAALYQEFLVVMGDEDATYEEFLAMLNRLRQED